MRSTIALVVAAVLAIGPVVAQEPGSQNTRNYIQSAGQSDAFEKLEAETALSQSSDPQVRGFAEMMLRDHDQTSRVLQQATKQAGLKPFGAYCHAALCSGRRQSRNPPSRHRGTSHNLGSFDKGRTDGGAVRRIVTLV
jgi:predicted outer membrane protein